LDKASRVSRIRVSVNLGSLSILRIVIVGGGIVGLSIAHLLAKKNYQVTLLEKEPQWAKHQTGHNSGVIHAGPYYKPGSLKSKMCSAGNISISAFAQDHGIAHEICGKLIVATQADEVGRLRDLAARAELNGVESYLLSAQESLQVEPHVNAIESLWVKRTGIIDYSQVAQKLAELAQLDGASLFLNTEVEKITYTKNSVVVSHRNGEVEADFVVNAAGLQSDRIARIAGFQPSVRIVPFRGEYFELTGNKEYLVRNLIYPVPNPELPFLGVHFTRMIGGGVHAGPNAVLATAREGYKRSNLNLRDTFETLAYTGFQKLALKNIQVGLMEIQRSFSKKSFTKSLQRLIPDISEADLQPSPSGVRAQAIDRSGNLVDDFIIEESDRQLHILNAPSPAATGCLEIGKYIVSRIELRNK
jgi:L-2-hydroxyglutarate oxidase